MDNLYCFCPKCEWAGTDYFVFDSQTRVALLVELQPGDVVPAGVCPHCGALVLPETLLKGRLTAREHQWGEPGATGEEWTVIVSRCGPGYAVHLQNPLGFGCEVSVELSQQRPVVQVTSWNTTDDALSAEPVGLLKVGQDHVLFTNSETSQACVVADDERMRSSLLTMQPWSALTRWEQVPA